MKPLKDSSTSVTPNGIRKPKLSGKGNEEPSPYQRFKLKSQYFMKETT
ncbi:MULTISPECIES: hypothetical protein [Lactobacillus]|nr:MULTISPECIES: hypothetical protein [Lactobacillus]